MRLPRSQRQAARTFRDKSAARYNALAHGVPADGSDALPAFERLIHRTMPEDAVLEVPAGYTFDVGGPLIVRNRIGITGGGRLRLRAGTTRADQVLALDRDGIEVDTLIVDGHRAGTRDNGGRGEALRLAASECVLRNVVVRDSKADGGGNALFVTGSRNLIEALRAIRGGYAGIRNDGDHNVYRTIRSDEFRVKGFVHNGSADRLDIDGYVARSATTDPAASEALLLDPGSGARLRWAFVRGLDLDGPNRAASGNTAKFALIDHLHVSDSTISHTNPHVTSVRIAEGVGFARFTNAVIGRTIAIGNGTGAVVLEDCLIGDGRAPLALRAFTRLGARVLRIRHSTVRRFTESALRETLPDDAIGLREIVHTELIGESDRTVYGMTEADGRGTRDPRRMIWTGSSIANAGGGSARLRLAPGAGALFGRPEKGRRGL